MQVLSGGRGEEEVSKVYVALVSGPQTTLRYAGILYYVSTRRKGKERSEDLRLMWHLD